MIYLIYLFIAACASGIIQSVCGFGAGIILMIVMPMFMPMIQASACSTMICIGGQITTLFIFRKYIDLKRFVSDAGLSLFCYLCFSITIIHYISGFNFTYLKLAFGAFLIILSIYYIFAAKKTSIRPTKRNAAICGGLSGITSGLFAIGGPPVGLYFLSYFGDDKVRYVVTLQILFLITSIINTGARAANGLINADCIRYVIAGVIAMAIGSRIGTKLIDKINADTMKKIIYAFIGVSGVITIVQNAKGLF